MKTSDFHYELPEELIAQTPVEPRDASRLLAYDRAKDSVLHKRFSDIPGFFKPGDVLVLNNTRVIPARLYGEKLRRSADTGGAASAKIEVLLLKRVDLKTWEVLLKPAKRLKPGGIVRFSPELSAELIAEKEDGNRIIRFNYDGVFEDILARTGEMPLPHYIKAELKDPERYQTVYASVEGSSAAPTAGLHFTPALLERIKEKGVSVCELTLDVGLGTFRPVKAERVTEHKMHSERFTIDEETAAAVNRAKREGGRVIAAGTTSLRALESAAVKRGELRPFSGDTDIFIYPGYEFKIIDGLLTNFHLPCSTLIMLVSAFLGREKTLEIYKTAVEERYRFFSFGDACFFL